MSDPRHLWTEPASAAPVSTVVFAQIPDVKLAMVQIGGLAEFGFKLLPWAVPLGAFAGWMVWPAITPAFKQQIGLETPPPTGQEFAFEKEGPGELPELTKGSV